MKPSPLPLLLACLAIFAPAFAAQSEEHHAWDTPPFGEEDTALYQAFQSSCAKFAKMKPAKYLHANKVFGTAGQWQSICAEGLAKSPHLLEDYLETRLTKLKLNGSSKFTGYYKPVMPGSRTRHGAYQTPLLAKPEDLTVCNGATGQRKANGQCLNPYPTRAEIENNLQNYKVILWLKDPTDAYFLHIQGSGTVELDTGTIAHVGFAGKNGHPYMAIGKVMKERGYISGSITADKIRAWLNAAPKAQRQEVLYSNPSYIFFQETEEESPGAYGVQLTAGRSVAVDRSHMPLGIPAFINTTNTFDNQPLRRIVFAHDVGSAIKGAGRTDIYFGHGPLAGERAGSQNAPGSFYALVPNENLGAISLAQADKPVAPKSF